MKPNLQSHVSDRIDDVIDTATCETYAAIMVLLEGHPHAAELESMLLALAGDAAAAAWCDGWQCARDPGRLVYAGEVPL